MYMFMNEIVKGDDLAVVEFMKTLAYDPDRFGSLDSYMEWLAQSLWQFQGLGVSIEGETLEARCGSLVESLVEYGILKPVWN